MTPPERAALGNIGLLIIQAQEANDIDLAKAALDKAVRQIVKLGKPKKPWQPRSGRYYLVDAPRGNGVEITPAELTRLIRLLEAAIRTHWTDSRKGMAEDEELLEKLRTL